VEVRRGLPGDGADVAARWLEAKVRGLHVVSVYLPNGNPVPSLNFDYKQRWMERLVAYGEELLAPGAPTVDLYEDFQCPICGQFEAALGSTFQDLAAQGKLKLNYHVLNFLDDKTGAKNSTPAANGAFCAANDGKFQEFHNAAFSSQVAEGQDVTDAELDAWASTAGITGDALTTWKKCVADDTYTKYVTSVNDAAFKIPGFGGTPTVIINGTAVDLNTIKTPELLTQAIQNATK
jgi:protein-disulfide isomerase